MRADELISDSFSQRNQIDEGVVIHSADLTAEEQTFREFVAGVRSSVEDTGATRIVSDPYSAEAGPAISRDGHAVAMTLTLGDDPEDGIEAVLDEVSAADADPAFDVAIAGEFTLDHDFNELAAHDLEKGELQIGLPAALVVLLLVFGALVAALVPMSIAIVSIVVAVGRPPWSGRSRRSRSLSST
ncbi:MAG: MMPL family transporter [Nocardioidaceae bacterium]|nr:MMPL family transporter [Nocardioidaceae bacterium]